MKEIRVVELFAGVGGFRLGLNDASKRNRKAKNKVVWSNQWEPSSGPNAQHASEIYVREFKPKEGEHSCEDIQQIVQNKFNEIKEHDLLVGGFPCQDYSVARTLSQSEGLQGKKGVLWWAIYDILKKNKSKKDVSSYLMLENVDRLIKSPSSQRGRDFAVMLSSLNELGYIVEWRIINAAEYGFPQRRRRIYILGYKKGTEIYKKIKKEKEKFAWLNKNGVIAKAFPAVACENEKEESFSIKGGLDVVSKEFASDSPKKTRFQNSGLMIDGEVFTQKMIHNFKGELDALRKHLEDEKDISPEFIIDEKKDLEKWKKLKGSKSEPRTSKLGFVYNYSEGAMLFPDDIDKPSRTIVTGEGGKSPSRFKHVIKTKSGYRRLTPVELESLNMFPKNHTKKEGVSDTKRAFLMGNALVVGVIDKLGKSLLKHIE